MSFEKMSTDEKKKKQFVPIEDTPQPHFVPGYTGLCPGISNEVGINYSRATHNILQNEPTIAGRLQTMSSQGPGSPIAEEENKREEDKKLIQSRTTSGRPVLAAYMPPGYTGHIPRNMHSVGKSYTKSCVEAIAEFEIERRSQKDEEKVNAEKNG